jgi:hypothetical protein
MLSITLVVQMTFRTRGGKAKKGMTCSQAVSHCRLIAG